MNKTGGMESMKIQHIAISEKSEYTISLIALAVGLIVLVILAYSCWCCMLLPSKLFTDVIGL